MPNAGDIIRLSDFNFTIYQDRFVLRKTGTQSISNTTDTDVTWDSEITDPNGLVSGTVTTFTVAAGKAGIWAANVVAQWAQATAADDTRVIRIDLNGRLVAFDSAAQHVGVNNSYNQCGCTWVGYLAEGDAVKITCWQDTGGALTIDNASAATQSTEWSMQRIVAA